MRLAASTAAAALEAWSTSTAVGIGELLWDLLPSGATLGGAPLNVGIHLARLGMTVRYVTAVGADDLGRLALDELQGLGLDTSLIQRSNLPTGAARVRLDASGVPTFEIVSPAAYEAVAAPPSSTIRGLADTRILVFGTLAQRQSGTLTTTRRLIESAPAAERLYDLNLRPGFWDADLVETLMSLATIAKLNSEEQAILARDFSLPSPSTERFARAAAERFGLRAVCVTRGADGAALLLDDEYVEGAARPVRVVDTVGAGDGFSAGLAAGLVAGWPGAAVLDFGLALAAAVVARAGATARWELGDIWDVDPED